MPRLEWLKDAVESVSGQTHAHWELCVCINGECGSEAEAWLKAQARANSRIVLVRTRRVGISAALNEAIAATTGEYLAFLDHDDTLEPTALAHVSGRLEREPLDLLYSDEGYIDEHGAPLQPNFKPGWSPELLLTCMYMGHLLVARRSLVLSAGGFRAEMDGAQDYDLALRLTELGARVGHIPRVLYQWRRHAASTASGESAKPYAREAGRRALEDAVRRRGWEATVHDGGLPNVFRLEMKQEPGRVVSIVIPTRSAMLLGRCLERLRSGTSGVRFETVVVHHHSEAGEDARLTAVAAEHGARVVAFAGLFDFANMCNEGAKTASGEILVFLNDDVEPLDPEWLVRLTAPLGREGVGIAGARLLYPQGSIQHVGMVLGMSDGVGHLGRHLMASTYWPWIDFSREVTAVTGACLACKKSVFEMLGGFDAAFPVNYNDVDLCLRARVAGYRVVVESGAVLIHRESMTRSPGTKTNERLTFQKRWGDLVEAGDEYFTPNLRLETEDLTLT
jgi:GT2 family glycosyltransferase